MLRNSMRRPGRLIVAVALDAVALGGLVALLFSSGYLISRAALEPPAVTLTLLILAVRLLAIGSGLVRYLGRLVGHSAALTGLADARGAVYRRMEAIGPIGTPVQALQGFVDDVDSVADLQRRALLPVLSGALVATCSVVLGFWLLPLAGAILLVALLVGGIIVPWVDVATERHQVQVLAEARDRSAAGFQTAVESARELIALQAQETMLPDLADADRELTHRELMGARWEGVGASLSVLAQGLAVVGCLVAAAASARAWELPGVEIAVVTLLPLAAYESVVAFPAAVHTFRQSGVAAHRVVAVLDAEPARPEPDEAVALPEVVHHLRARGASIARPDGSTKAIADLDLDVGPGRRVAIVGPSGCGNSSLAMAMLGFLPYSGSLTLDAVELRDLAGDTLRGTVGLLAEDDHLFSTTIDENLRVASPWASPAQVHAAVAAAGLGDWLTGLPEGLATAAGWNGANFSTDERQRLALARMLLGSHPLVVLDEPTTAGRFLSDALAALADRGVVLLTNDIDQASGCDEVVVLLEAPATRRGAPIKLGIDSAATDR